MAQCLIHKQWYDEYDEGFCVYCGVPQCDDYESEEFPVMPELKDHVFAPYIAVAG